MPGVCRSWFPTGEGGNAGAFVLELDVGYLVGLLQHIALGSGTFVQILDSDGAEWIRANNCGVIGGNQILPAIPAEEAMPFGAGDGEVELAGERVQRVWVSRRDRGFTVVVNQPYEEILAPIEADQYRKMILNLLVTMLVTAIISLAETFFDEPTVGI